MISTGEVKLNFTLHSDMIHVMMKNIFSKLILGWNSFKETLPENLKKFKKANMIYLTEHEKGLIF